jgi:hypothetical protein
MRILERGVESKELRIAAEFQGLFELVPRRGFEKPMHGPVSVRPHWHGTPILVGKGGYSSLVYMHDIFAAGFFRKMNKKFGG